MYFSGCWANVHVPITNIRISHDHHLSSLLKSIQRCWRFYFKFTLISAYHICFLFSSRISGNYNRLINFKRSQIINSSGFLELYVICTRAAQFLIKEESHFVVVFLLRIEITLLNHNYLTHQRMMCRFCIIFTLCQLDYCSRPW